MSNLNDQTVVFNTNDEKTETQSFIYSRYRKLILSLTRGYEQIINANPDNEITHNKNEVYSKSVVIEKQGGLKNKFVISLLLAWYFCSAITLYTNKYIITTRKIDPTLIGTCQMIVTCICCLIHMNYNRKKKFDLSILEKTSKTSMSNFYKDYISTKFLGNMLIIGFLRLFSIVLGLMALKAATISFVETIKSSSPLFTVVISKLLIGEETGFWTRISLLPIMLGLALCSSYELNFSLFGFLAAILTNVTECIQNVFSKLLLCNEKNKFTPLQVQFFTSLSSTFALIPICYYNVEYTENSYDMNSLFLYALNGLSFNCQSFLAFMLMSYISPVTYSVCNTVKRALLIWISVILFQNKVTLMSAFGTFLVIFGVLTYNQAKIKDTNTNEKKIRQLHKI